VHIVLAALATWVTVHVLRSVAAELDRVLIAPANLGASVLAAVGWGLGSGLDAVEIAAALALAALLNKFVSLITVVTDRLLLRNRQ
jgi:hypothetical protein